MSDRTTSERGALVRLGGWSHDHRRAVVLLWLLALVGTFALSQSFGGDFALDFKIPASESSRALDQLKAHFPQAAGDGIDVVYTAPSVTEPAVVAEVDALLAKAKADSGHVLVALPASSDPKHRVSADGTIAYASLRLDVQSDDMPHADTKRILADTRAANRPGLQIELNGFAVRYSDRSGPGGEGIGLAAAALILLISFGSLLAMGLPLLIAVFGLGIGTALMALIANVVQTPSFATQVASMIGIGVGIDYVLFIVTRYRSELHRGRDVRAAVVTALGTAGRAVVFAGCTVIISLLGLFVIGLKFLQGLAISAAAGVLVIVVASVTLLPALLGFIGRTIDRFHVPFVKSGVDDAQGFWYRWSRIVQRRPWPAAIAGLAVIVLVTVPLFGVRFGFPDAGNDARSSTTRKAYDLQTKGFGVGSNGQLLLVAELQPGADQSAQLGRVRDALATADPRIVAVSDSFFTSADKTTAIAQLQPSDKPQSQVTEDLVHDLRAKIIPAATAGTGIKVSVGGQTAASVDLSTYLANRLPWFIGTVVALSFLLLMAVFRSVLVALKAAIMNVFSILAAYGVAAYAMQGNWLSHLIGVDERVPLTSFVPMMMFAILFGLSMDYEVFMLSRVREEYVRTGDNAQAVADGLAQTARVITAAAAIMVAVFGGFVFGDDVIVKAVGIGMAAAILIDATVVRMVLVPSTMELLGNANWWIPRWLDRLLPDLHLEGGVPDEEPDVELVRGEEPEPDPVTVGG